MIGIKIKFTAQGTDREGKIMDKNKSEGSCKYVVKEKKTKKAFTIFATQIISFLSVIYLLSKIFIINE